MIEVFDETLGEYVILDEENSDRLLGSKSEWDQDGILVPSGFSYDSIHPHYAHYRNDHKAPSIKKGGIKGDWIEWLTDEESIQLVAIHLFYKKIKSRYEQRRAVELLRQRASNRRLRALRQKEAQKIDYSVYQTSNWL